MLSTFQTQTSVPADVESLFDFHCDPNNLSVVMPPTLKLISLKTDGVALPGRLIELHCRDFWIIPMRWTCRWKTVEKPHLLEDEILKGPFVVFIHQHRFEPLGPDSTLMQDQITYQWGHSWWGHLVSETGVKIYLTLLFKFRHHRTKKWATSQLRNKK